MNEYVLIGIVNTKMPYGKYRGWLLYRIPQSYLEWLQRQGFKRDQLGMKLSTLYEIRINGLEDLLDPIIKKGL